MKIIRNLLLISIFIVGLAKVSSAQGDILSAADFMKMVKAKKELVIIDASKSETYTKSHVKNAVNIPHATLYKEGDIEGLIMEPNKLAEIFASKGVSNDKLIVVYDGGSQKYSSRVYWILKYLGASDVKILHKDMNEWRKSRVPITKMPTKTSKGTFTVSLNKSIIADINEVKSGSAVILDARAADEFDGSADKSDGHLPGSVNIDYKDFLTESGAFKTQDELLSLLKSKGITSSSEIISYCRTSVRATVIYAAIVNVLGWNNIKVYDGAYLEWIAKGNKLQTKAGVAVSKKTGSASGGC
ncbi:MAG: hypothetical protein C0598_09085 [Marinilabiliales bacterium]|nr:MAG: hypothetical protein C0598_09085 [Marinilabiliales bacterium]